MTKRYDLKLEGVNALDMPIETLRELCDLFLEGARRCARLVAEGRSSVRGPAPSWLAEASDVRIVSYRKGSLELVMQAPVLAEVVPDLFAQQQLFPRGSATDATAVDLLLDAMRDASADRKDSERLDAGILEVLLRAGRVFERGASKLIISDERAEPVVFEAETTAVVEALAQAVPKPRVGRVRGLLDTVTATTHAIVLRVGGRELRGNAAAMSLERLRTSLGKEVMLEGWVTFRPSGDAIRVEVESLFEPTEGDAIWAKLPFAEPERGRPKAPSASSIETLFGKWPGDESDEDLLLALAELQ